MDFECSFFFLAVATVLKMHDAVFKTHTIPEKKKKNAEIVGDRNECRRHGSATHKLSNCTKFKRLLVCDCRFCGKCAYQIHIFLYMCMYKLTIVEKRKR